MGEIVTRAEGRPVPRQDHDVYTRIRIGSRHGFGQRRRNLVVDRVQNLGAIEGDAPDPAISFV